MFQVSFLVFMPSYVLIVPKHHMALNLYIEQNVATETGTPKPKQSAERPSSTDFALQPPLPKVQTCFCIGFVKGTLRWVANRWVAP